MTRAIRSIRWKMMMRVDQRDARDSNLSARSSTQIADSSQKDLREVFLRAGPLTSRVLALGICCAARSECAIIVLNHEIDLRRASETMICARSGRGASCENRVQHNAARTIMRLSSDRVGVAQSLGWGGGKVKNALRNAKTFTRKTRKCSLASRLRAAKHREKLQYFSFKLPALCRPTRLRANLYPSSRLSARLVETGLLPVCMQNFKARVFAFARETTRPRSKTQKKKNCLLPRSFDAAHLSS